MCLRSECVAGRGFQLALPCCWQAFVVIRQVLFPRWQVIPGHLKSAAVFLNHLQKMPQALESCLASAGGCWLHRETMREPKILSLQRTKVCLFTRDELVCIEVNVNQGIPLLFICDQLNEVPKSMTTFQDHLALKNAVACPWEKPRIRSNLVRDCQLKLAWLHLIFLLHRI